MLICRIAFVLEVFRLLLLVFLAGLVSRCTDAIVTMGRNDLRIVRPCLHHLIGGRISRISLCFFGIATDRMISSRAICSFYPLFLPIRFQLRCAVLQCLQADGLGALSRLGAAICRIICADDPHIDPFVHLILAV